MTPIHRQPRLDRSATLEDVYRELTNLPSVIQVKTLTEPPIGVPALAVELVDDTSRIAVEMLLASTTWHVTETLSERTGRWVQVGPFSGNVASCVT
jgi:hypothetical protein